MSRTNWSVVSVAPLELDLLGRQSGGYTTGIGAAVPVELDSSSRMMRVEVDLDNAEGRLTPGFFGYVTVHHSEK